MERTYFLIFLPIVSVGRSPSTISHFFMKSQEEPIAFYNFQLFKNLGWYSLV